MTGVTEHGEQSAFIDWVKRNWTRLPQLRTLHAIPNGAALARVKLEDGTWSRGTNQARRLLAEGLLPGILDIHLPTRGVGSHSDSIGLWLEFKLPGRQMSSDQREIAALLRDEGHEVVLCRKAEDGIDAVEEYLAVPLSERTQHFE